MHTIPFVEFEATDANTPVQETGITGSYASARLGPYYVPRGVVVHLTPTKGCTFMLDYENEEPGESWPRSLDGGLARVLLGKRSRKVLSIHLPRPHEVLQADRPLFDPSESVSWCRELSEDRQFACVQNAVVVADVLAKMPTEIRARILQATDPRAAK
ncbi:MAG: hypothetical protein IT360_25355 [Gemmatimonadaceae bacterium]|nr:hypothetical protein [Gemmatimonadaceae bacterium]